MGRPRPHLVERARALARGRAAALLAGTRRHRVPGVRRRRHVARSGRRRPGRHRTLGTDLDAGPGLGGRDRYRLLNDVPLTAVNGRITMTELFPRSLGTVQFVRIVPEERGARQDPLHAMEN